MDLDQLALETFTLKSPYAGMNPFTLNQSSPSSNENGRDDFWRVDEVMEQDQEGPLRFAGLEISTDIDRFADEAESIRSWLYPEGPGLLFRVDRLGPTFCLRGMISKNLKADFERLGKDTEILTDVFRLDPITHKSDSIDQVLFYETQSVELAEVIYDQLFNRRLPVEEDLLCNLSDPGFSWWFKQKDQTFKIYFRSHGVTRVEDCVRLGPIGDRKIAVMRLTQLQPLLLNCPGVKGFELTDKKAQFSFEGESEAELEVMNEVLDLFLKGRSPTNLIHESEKGHNKTLSYYLSEVAALRSFWLEVEAQISS